MLWAYPRELDSGIFLKRYKRFFTDVERSDGTLETVHCANSGSMLSCMEERCAVYTLDSRNPARKLRHSLELMKLQDGFACVNTARANQVAEAFLKHALEFSSSASTALFAGLDRGQQNLIEKDFKNLKNLKRESVYNAHTRFDFSCESGESHQKHWIEVKSVSLRLESGMMAFPDAKTERGQKHLKELTEAVGQDQQATLLFVCMRAADIPPQDIAKGFQIAGHIDPAYLSLFHQAIAAGVKVRLLVPAISPLGFGLRGYFDFANL